MGLDSVELLMAIEEEFGLEIPDSAAEGLYTVGDVYEYLKKRLASTPAADCLSQQIFYKLRRGLIENYKLHRQSITPDTRLSDLLSIKQIEEGWPYLKLFIDLKTPKFPAANKLLGFKLTSETMTMRDLVAHLIYLNLKAMSAQQESDEAIWHRLVAVFLREVNVTIDQIVPEASITRDLGVE